MIWLPLELSLYGDLRAVSHVLFSHFWESIYMMVSTVIPGGIFRPYILRGSRLFSPSSRDSRTCCHDLPHSISPVQKVRKKHNPKLKVFFRLWKGRKKHNEKGRKKHNDTLYPPSILYITRSEREEKAQEVTK